MKPGVQIFFFLLLFSSFARSQENRSPVLYSITEKQGLTDNSVNCFFQDSRGVMWMGTNYGLNSYDGSVIQNYHAVSTAPSLSNDAVNDIKEDNNKTLWIATGNGLSSFDIAKKQFHVFRYNSKDEVLNRYYSLAIINNEIYLATEEGLVEFQISSQKFILHKNPLPNTANNHISKILADSKKRIWLGTYNGLWLADPSSNKFTSYDNPANDLLFDELVTDIYEDHSGQLWFGTWAKGLKKIDPGTKTVETFLHFKGSSTNLVTITEQKSGNNSYDLWVSSNLSRLDIASASFAALVPPGNEKKSVAFANRVYCDRTNLLWISTPDGVSIYNPAKQYFNTKILSTFVPLTSQGICLYPLKDKFLLGGEGGTALMLFSDSVKLQKNFSQQINQGAAVMAIQTDGQHNYWLCTSNGLMILDSSFNKKQVLLHNDNDPNSLPKNFLNSILFKKDGEIWLLPWRKGIWRMDRATQKFYRVITKNNDSLLPVSNLSKAIEDDNGNIWITDLSGGLFKYSPQQGTIENIITGRRLSNEYIINGKLWTVSAQEIFAVDIISNKIEIYLLPEGKNKYEYDFIPGDNGYLWIATKNGLLAFNTAIQQFQHFTEDDGLYSNLADISFARLSNGNILMAGGTYATTFSPDIVLENKSIAPLIFTSALVGEKEKFFQANSLDLSWDEKNISLNWALLNFSNPSGNIYYYKLDDVDKDWQRAGNRGQANFNSLEPGEYIFHYKAATPGGMMSDEKTITLIINPPWWRTWWFRLLGIVIAGLLFFFIVRYISQRNLKERILRLEKEQAVEKERNRISRDMHDELGSGLTKIAVLSEVIKTQKNTGDNIDKISETARTLVDNLDEMVWALNPKNDSLDKLAAYIAEYAHQYLEDTGITCSVDLPLEIKPLQLSEEKRRNIFMVVKEFLNNTVKHSGAKNLYVRLTQNENAFEIYLKDDGKGVDENVLNGLGNGLKNMQQRIEDIGGKLKLGSSPGEGTSLVMVCNA